MHAERIRVVSELDPGDESFDVSDDHLMRVLADAEERHFWHITRNEWIVERLAALGFGRGSSMIELGCGGGCVTSHLARAGIKVVGVEGQRSLVVLAASRAPEASFWVHDLRRGVGELPERGFDVAGLFDVIEHIDRPQDVLRGACSLVREGGLVVGTVPALQSLWSRIDEQAGHRVRYEAAGLRAVLSEVECARVVEVVPFNRVLVPLMWVQRKLVTLRGRAAASEANLSVPAAPVNRVLATMLRAERKLMGGSQRGAGSSLWFAIRLRENSPRSH